MKPILLDQLIDTELLAQRAKELSLDVEPQVNQQLLRIMKENNLQSLDELEQKMREVGVDINEVRRLLRARFASDAVRSRRFWQDIFQPHGEGETGLLRTTQGAFHYSGESDSQPHLFRRGQRPGTESCARPKKMSPRRHASEGPTSQRSPSVTLKRSWVKRAVS